MDCVPERPEEEKMKATDLGWKRKWLFLLVILISAFAAYAIQPGTPNSIVNVSTESPNVTMGYVLNTSGGTITTVNINATTQNMRWKGFVGNIQGALALQDSTLNSLIKWTLETTTGELYATRYTTVPDWSNIGCADDSDISDEETALNIVSTNVDSINRTFNSTTHNGFYAGLAEISSNSCRAVALNVNNSEQTTQFQEVLLTDSTNLIYSSLIENSAYGFNNKTYDFQMVVAENALEGEQPNTEYYFYIELI